MFEDILFLDLEVKGEKIEEIGLVIGEKRLKTTSLSEAKNFILSSSLKLVAGHNLFKFDDSYLKSSKLSFLTLFPYLDTLPISLLLFSEKTFHNLPKEYKDEDNFFNDPLKDALLTKELLKRCVERFNSLEPSLQLIFYSLLKEQKEFKNFFTLVNPPPSLEQNHLLETIISHFPLLKNLSLLKTALTSYPIELAYILSLNYSIIKAHPPKILHDYPDIVELHKNLTSFTQEEIVEFMHQTFGFGGFREFVAVDNSSFISQQDIVLEALKDNSLIAILPTGGGKTFTFWLPALFRASKIKSLTVVISPLQALIQDQLKNFQRQVANFTAVAISGYQSYLERADAIEKVITGEADILYLAPESLRNETTFKILKNRVIERFVIDEAHCLSIWGHDFRHDYFYIAEFIEDLLKVQPWAKKIPISCFSATAKANVIKDIQNYFKEKLSLTLTPFIAKPSRENLNYFSIVVKKEEEKFPQLLELLKETPALVYLPSSTKKCEKIALELQALGFNAKPFHAKLEREEKNLILKEFIEDKIEIVVATTAFGMGVDKPNIKTVIHYEISSSLENYVQEAGRGARDPNLKANCYVLFLEDDLDSHFLNLNLNKISSSEINSIFRALKAKSSKEVYITSRELALKAGWDIEKGDWDSKVKTALLELERAGYLQRKRNKTRFFASSVVKNPFQKLASHKKELSDKEYQLLLLTLNALLGRGKPKVTQVDEIAFILERSREEIVRAILKLKEFKILEEAYDIQLTLKRGAKQRLEELVKVETALLRFFKKNSSLVISLRSLNEYLIDEGIVEKNVTLLIQELLKSWRRKGKVFHFSRIDRLNDLWRCEVINITALEKSILLKHSTTKKVLSYLLSFNSTTSALSLLDIAKNLDLDIKLIDRALFYLHSFEVIELGEGRFIYYSPMHIVKSELFFKKRRYTKNEYSQRLQPYYRQKVEAIHIVGEFVNRLKISSTDAKKFLGDYFILKYEFFKKRYKLLKEEITRPLTQKRFKKIFGDLSPTQLEIIKDNSHQGVMVLAGPGSGKTKVLVHKIASLLLQEDVKPQHFLMLTFSHSAVTEFRERSLELIGKMAKGIEIKTFHSFALKLLGRVVNEETLLEKAIPLATKEILEGNLILPFKSVLMLDEFQDVNLEAFEFIKALYQAYEKNLRIIAVGDDDQTILESVTGANPIFFKKFTSLFEEYKEYYLLENYRSTPQILSVAQKVVSKIPFRLKRKPLVPKKPNGWPVELIFTPSSNLVQTAVSNFGDKLDPNLSTAFLTYTNEEVAQVYSLLYEKGLNPSYPTLRYRLKNLAEIFTFGEIVKSLEKPFLTNKEIEKVIAVVKRKYKNSKNLPLLEKVVETFLREYGEFYLSWWLDYVEEIEPEEFEEQGKLSVTTMHKSKGREFDHTIVIVPTRNHTPEWLRVLYVAFTRAKSNLSIVTNDKELVTLLTDPNNLFFHLDTKTYPSPSTKTYLMGLDDVVLSYSFYSFLKKQPVAGDSLSLLKVSKDQFFLTFNNHKVEKLSKKFSLKLNYDLSCNFFVKEITTDAIVFWKDKERDVYLPHLLAKVVMSK